MNAIADLSARAEQFLKLHQGSEPLVLVNVWDVASARIVERVGFPALATSSAGVAFALGYPDGEHIGRDEMLAAVQRITCRISIPLSADLEAGYGDMAKTARALVQAGAVGLNFEDGTDDPEDPLAEIGEQVAKIKKIRETGDSLGVHIVINARTDVYLAQAGKPEDRFEHAVARLEAYRDAGADCLFAPGVYDAETIGNLVAAVGGPLNILAAPGTPPLAELARLGVRRVSLGSWPMRAATGSLQRFARQVRDTGDFSSIGEGAVPYAEMNELMAGE
jgi:2-methylisocitrate lyase-like PEP mutase family enzyme